MKRRDFIKTTACLGCAGMLNCKALKSDAFGISKIKTNLEERNFIYKSEADLPKKIRIDICNLCQLNCVKCCVRLSEKQIKKHEGFGYVPFETFKNFVDKHSFIEEIELSRYGEIFLNPDIDKIIEYAHQKGIALTAYTGVNLNKLSEETAENLVKYQFKGMVVSIDGATPETYAIYRRGGDFNTVINNIKKIQKYKEKYNSEYPEIVWKFIVFGHNEHEIDDVKAYAAKLNVPLYFDLNSVDGYSPLKDPKMVHEKTGLHTGYISETPKNDEHITSMKNYYEKDEKTKNDWFYCDDLFKYPQINWDGNLLGCCRNLPGFKINVFEDGLLNALNKEKYLYAKVMLTNFNIPPREDVPCSECIVYKTLKSDNMPLNYLKNKD